MKSGRKSGVMFLYSATGEATRLQFISNDCMDNEGRVVDFNGVYDLKVGDQVKILRKGFINTYHTVDENFLETFMNLQRFLEEELLIDFKPGADNKSWKELV